MYDPKGNGKERAVDAVHFAEAEPPQHQRGIVHRFLELNTGGMLTDDYRFHALPDACTYIVFDQINRDVMGVSQLRAKSEEFNLGLSFHSVNIRLLPGVWQGGADRVINGMVDAPYVGDLPLAAVNDDLDGQVFASQCVALAAFVDDLMAQGLVAPNPITEQIFQNLDDIQTVGDMADATGLSARQLQRRLKSSTGFAPHDFLKVLRLQQSLNGADTWDYADQSYFIHSFRNATGYTPGKYAKKFDV